MSSTRTRAKENPKIRERSISDGRKSLYLEYYLGRTSTLKKDENGNPVLYESGKMAGTPMYEVKHQRRKEELKLYLYSKPRTAEERAHNKNTIEQAQRIRNARERDWLAGTMGYSRMNSQDNIIPYFEAYISTYTKTDVRNLKLSLNRFKQFLRLKYPSCVMPKTEAEVKRINDEWEEAHRGINGRHEINPNEFYMFHLNQRQFTEGMVREFVSYLQESSTGEGAATIFARFKKIAKNIAKQGYLSVNPCADVVCKKSETAEKDILSDDEITALLHTQMDRGNPNIRRAFLFTLYTGVRWCDVKELEIPSLVTPLFRFELPPVKKLRKESFLYHKRTMLSDRYAG